MSLALRRARPLAGAALFASGVLAGLGLASAPAHARPEPSPAAKALAELCAKALKEAEDLRSSIGGDKGPEDCARWSLRLVQATRDLGDGAQTKEVLKAHLERTKAWEEWTKKKRAEGSATGMDVLESQFRRAEAELWVEQGK